MEERYTTEEVDEALRVAEEEGCGDDFGDVLASEVRALREEQRQKVAHVIIRTWEVPRGMKFSTMPEFYAKELMEELLAKMDRVEAFCDEADKRGAPYAVALRAVLRATS